MPRRPKLHSQEMRLRAPEIDSLRLGTGYSLADLDKPQILIDSVGGESHPNSVHLPRLADLVRDGVLEAGGAPARYAVTDMCDGVAQGTDAMDYSLASRELIAMAVELHARAGHFDGLVLVSGGDKAVPGHLMAALRLNLPAVHVPGGVMEHGPVTEDLTHHTLTLEMVGTAYGKLRRGEMEEEEYRFLCINACPTAGGCAFLGTSGTMQVMAEALGLALPGSALRPQHLRAMDRGCREAGNAVLRLVERNLRTRDIVTQEALENAIIVHAAIGGSTNVLLHLPAIAREAGLDWDLRRVQEINDNTPFILNARPCGEHTTNLVWFAGAVPAIQWELRDLLHLGVRTATGRTLGQNLRHLRSTGWFAQLPRFLATYGLQKQDLIRSTKKPLAPQGTVAFLSGNLAPDGAVVKRTAVHPSMRRFTGRARVFGRQEEALDAIYEGRIKPGTVVVIRYEGPRGSGMPEQFYVTEAISSNPRLNTGVALVTDGRFSGASAGPCIGHVSPEAAAGGPIALVENGDLIEIDIERGRLNIVGAKGKPLSSAEARALLRERKRRWQPPPLDGRRGLLGLYTHLATSPARGAMMEW